MSGVVVLVVSIMTRDWSQSVTPETDIRGNKEFCLYLPFMIVIEVKKKKKRIISVPE